MSPQKDVVSSQNFLPNLCFSQIPSYFIKEKLCKKSANLFKPEKLPEENVRIRE